MQHEKFEKIARQELMSLSIRTQAARISMNIYTIGNVKIKGDVQVRLCARLFVNNCWPNSHHALLSFFSLFFSFLSIERGRVRRHRFQNQLAHCLD